MKRIMETFESMFTTSTAKPARWRRRSSSKPWEAGFSLIEAIVALAVFSGLGVTLASISIMSFQALEKAHQEMVITAEESYAEDLIRKSVSDIRFPLWLAEISTVEEDGALSIPYLVGNKDLIFSIKFENDLLTIDAATDPDAAIPVRRVFNVFSKATWEILKSEKDEAYGISFTLQPHDPAAPPIIIAERFGSAPLGKLYE
jgi:hypothetical protein